MEAANEEQEEEDLLALCEMVEEYKECFELSESENQDLKYQLQMAQQEIEKMKGNERKHLEVIERLDDSVNQLVEEIEENNAIIEAKNADLSSLQHVLNVIHRRKVDVDDLTQLEQSRQIETLLLEKNKLSQAYSMNLKIMEDYLSTINRKDSEILDLKHTIKNLELLIASTNSEESIHLENANQGSESKQDEFVQAASMVSPTKKVLVKSSRGNPSPPTSAPPSQYTASKANNSTMRPATAPASKQYTDNPSLTSHAPITTKTTIPTSATNTTQSSAEKLAAVRRTSYVINSKESNNEYSSDENVEEDDNSPILPISVRNKSTRMQRSYTSLPTTTTTTTSTTKNNNIANKISTEDVNNYTSAAQKALALSKYRRYAALNNYTTDSSNINQTNTATSNNTYTTATSNNTKAYDDLIDDVDTESSYIDTNITIDSTRSVPKWSDVGKHERLFDKVDIIKNHPKYASTVNKNHKPRSEPYMAPHTNQTTKSGVLYDTTGYDDTTDYTHPTLNTSIQSQHSNNDIDQNNDSVEIFVEVDSNPPTPQRVKPNKLFKPPFSKPVFNEFTHNTLKGNTGSVGNAGSGGVDVNSSTSSNTWSKKGPSQYEQTSVRSVSSTGSDVGDGGANKKTIRSASRL